jgi:hypothetical protein
VRKVGLRSQHDIDSGASVHMEIDESRDQHCIAEIDNCRVRARFVGSARRNSSDPPLLDFEQRVLNLFEWRVEPMSRIDSYHENRNYKDDLMVAAAAISDNVPMKNANNAAGRAEMLQYGAQKRPTAITSQNVIIQWQSGDSSRGAVSSLRPFCTVGEWLSLVEHLVRDQGVGGSNPLSPTNLFKHLNCTSGFPSTLMVSIL